MAWEATQVLVAPNRDFETEFGDPEYLEGIKHDGGPNRTIATTTQIGLRSFSAQTSIVQWGKYEGKDAVLLVFSLNFDYRPESRERITEAYVTITLEETADETLVEPTDRSIHNDPIVKRIGPVKWEGEGHKVEKVAIRWEINPQVSVGDVAVKFG